MKTLAEIYENFKGSDKGTVHSYIDVYEKLLAPYRRPGVQLVEIGVDSGDSLQMWKEYFPDGQVLGVDVVGCPGSLTADATNPESVKALFHKNQRFDVVIDDASHVLADQLSIYDNFRPLLNHGGIYIIEDIQDIDTDRERFEKMDCERSVEIIDRRPVKGRFDDVMVVLDLTRSMNHYSQHNEQEFILEFFNGKRDGFFLDIGAGDGWNDSNTRALWDLGWSGMLIEPNYVAFKQLMEVYGSGERAVLIYAAINDRNGPVQFWEHPESGWSSLRPKYLGERTDYRPKVVQGLRLDSLNITRPVDFMSIDVEGLEPDILSTLPPSLNPMLIMAEADKPGTACGIGMILIKRGYQEVWHNSANVAYAKGR